MNHVTSDPERFQPVSLTVLLWIVSDAVCNMESGMCTWSNTQNSEVDKLDWELTSRGSDKHYSMPLSDHTLGTDRGNTSASHYAKGSSCSIRAKGCGFNSRDSSCSFFLVIVSTLQPFHVIVSTQYLIVFTLCTMCLLGSPLVSNWLMVSLHVLPGSAGFSPFLSMCLPESCRVPQLSSGFSSCSSNIWWVLSILSIYLII